MSVMREVPRRVGRGRFAKGVFAGALVTAATLAAGAAYAGPEIGALFSVKGTCSNGIASIAASGAAKCVTPYTAYSTTGTH
jgi:hypothetical protein